MADPAYIVNGVLTDGEAWVAVASEEPNGSVSVVTFTSTDDGQVGDWSQYMDLVVISYVQFTTGSGSPSSWFVNLNNDTAANYDLQFFRGGGSGPAVQATAQTGQTEAKMGFATTDGTANIFTANVAHFFDINSGKYKTILCQEAGSNDSDGYVGLVANTWLSQAAVTELDFTADSTPNFESGTRFDLFGVLPRMVA